MSRRLFFLTSVFFLSLFECDAQVTGSDTVCAGYIYSYTVNIPGAASFTWTVPANWYGLTGQGTSHIDVTCNVNAGQVCAEAFDSMGISLGTQCLTTNMGAPSGGGGNWHLDPSGFNAVCDNVTSVNVIPTIVYTGGGGGGCLNGCGTGAGSNPNIVFALYSGQVFQGVIGTMMNLGLGTYYAAYVDTTLGCNFPQAVQISGGGCGGSGGGSFSIGQIWLQAIVYQDPTPVCIGDTVMLWGNGSSGGWGGPYWFNLNNLTAVSSIYNPGLLEAIVTAPNASVYYSVDYEIQSGISWGSICSAYTTYSVVTNNCNAVASMTANDSSLCENSCISFTNNSLHAVSYLWNFPGAVPDTSTAVNPGNICYSAAGSYDVSLIASNSGHADTLVMSNYITVLPRPQAGFAAVDTTFCTPGCVGFINSSSNATSYAWSFQGANPPASTATNPQSLCYNAAGDFSVSLISSNSGCSDSLTIPNYIHALVSPQSGMGANPVSFCPGSCTDFTNFTTNAFSYQWNFLGAVIDTSSQENPQGICYNVPGQYGVQLISSNDACTDTLTVSNYITVYPHPPSLSVNVINDTLFSNQGFDSYQWYLNGNIIPAATDYYCVATANGDYSIVASDTNGCEVEAVINNVMVGENTFISALGFTISPNPFKNMISLHQSRNSAMKINIELINSLGEILYATQNILEDRVIDLSFLNSGIYFLKVMSDRGMMLRKIVKW